ncbi:hypothetical protein CF327_g201 [Tilletia walkeri]|nr:hypothetical protein CF327_g201 [Tilletia walkeri]
MVSELSSVSVPISVDARAAPATIWNDLDSTATLVQPVKKEPGTETDAALTQLQLSTPPIEQQRQVRVKPEPMELDESPVLLRGEGKREVGMPVLRKYEQEGELPALRMKKHKGKGRAADDGFGVGGGMRLACNGVEPDFSESLLLFS